MSFCCVEVVKKCTLKIQQIALQKFCGGGIFLVLISPTGSYTQIKWAGTFVDDFFNPLNTESNDELHTEKTWSILLPLFLACLGFRSEES